MPESDRQDAIFNLIHSGIPADEIFRKMRIERRNVTDIKGVKTEHKFQQHMWAYFAGILTSVEKASPEDDVIGIDFYVTFKSGQKLPVQVKSSDAAVLAFKNDPRFIKDFNRKIIVINSEGHVSKSKFKTAFSKELHRIEKLDKSYPKNNN